MVCFQVLARFAFYQRKPILAATLIKKHNNAQAHLVLSGLPFGSGLKISRFFYTKKEAAQFVSFLLTVYKNRIIPNLPLPGGQLTLF